jgi:pyruvate ferredoxin oxidoreductase beta subunit
VREALRALGSDIIVVNATGCMEIVSTRYPQSMWLVPYIHSLFENAPAVASGVSAALKAKGNAHTKVVVIAGDGSTYDIGFGSLSGMLERDDDVLYICYNNECYANTGVQRSGATPFAAATTTSPAGKQQWRKNIAFIAAAHGAPYVASACISYPKDFENKLKKAVALQGAKYVEVLSPCPIGWRFDSDATVQLGKKAVETGLWSLFEIENGAFRRTLKPQLKPVEEYFKMQGRFKGMSAEQTAAAQQHVQKAQAELERLEASGLNLREML